MNILIVSQHFSPDEFRVNDIARQMAADGHTVRVITGLPDYTTTRIPKEYRGFRRRRETLDGVEVVRVPTIARRTGVLFRALNYLSFVVSGKLYARFTKFRPDVVYSYETSPVLQVMPAITAARRRRVPLVIYCCDIWPECLKIWGVKESSLLFRYIKRLSRRIFNAGDRVAITSEPFRAYLREVDQVPEEKIVLIPQHAEDIFGDIAGVYEDNGCMDFLFAGNVGSAQNVDNIVRAAAHLRHMTDVPFHLHVVGDGTARPAAEALAAELQVEDLVTFHGKFPQSDMPRFYKMADAFLLTMSESLVGAVTLPAKWQGYISAGKPIAVAAGGICEQMTQLVDCGLCAPAGDAEALAAVLCRMMADPERCRAQGARGRRYYEENSTKEIFMERLYALFGEVLRSHKET